MGSFNCAISPRVASSKSCLSFIVMAWRTAALARSVLVVAPLDSVPCWAIAGVPANAVAASSIVAIARAFSILGLLDLVVVNRLTASRLRGFGPWRRRRRDTDAHCALASIAVGQGTPTRSRPQTLTINTASAELA